MRWMLSVVKSGKHEKHGSREKEQGGEAWMTLLDFNEYKVRRKNQQSNAFEAEKKNEKWNRSSLKDLKPTWRLSFIKKVVYLFIYFGKGDSWELSKEWFWSF